MTPEQEEAVEEPATERPAGARRQRREQRPLIRARKAAGPRTKKKS